MMQEIIHIESLVYENKLISTRLVTQEMIVMSA